MPTAYPVGFGSSLFLRAFDTKDLRGLRIVFPQESWDHIKDRGRFNSLPRPWPIVMNAFAASPLVLDNEPLGEFRTGPERRADERYVSFVPELNQYLIVPVKIFDTPISRPGKATLLPPPIRLALTAYADPEIPPGKVLFKWPPDGE